jgi:hypothetical protein
MRHRPYSFPSYPSPACGGGRPRAAASGGWGRCWRNPTRLFASRRATLPLQGRDKEADMRHRPCSLRPRAGRRLVLLRAPQNPRERGTPKVLTDPRTSTPRDIEACRNPFCPPFERAAASSPFPRRPARGVFRFAPLRPRQSAFHASHLRRRDALSTVAGVLACGRPVPLTDTGHTYAVKRPPRRAAGAPGQKRLGPPDL